MDVPWVSLLWDNYYTEKIPHAAEPLGTFWWRDILKLTPVYRGVSRVRMVTGSTALFWKDLWNDNVLEITHPRAFSFATKEDVSVEDFLGSTTLDENFYLPLSPQALDEVHDLQEISMHLQPSTSPNDVWSYAWGKTEFKASDYYKFCFREADAHPTFSHLWKSHCIMRIKVFGWLLIHDRLNTRNMLKRRHFNIGDDHTCLLCGLQVKETVDHMIFSCSFSQAC